MKKKQKKFEKSEKNRKFEKTTKNGEKKRLKNLAKQWEKNRKIA